MYNYFLTYRWWIEGSSISFSSLGELSCFTSEFLDLNEILLSRCMQNFIYPPRIQYFSSAPSIYSIRQPYCADTSPCCAHTEPCCVPFALNWRVCHCLWSLLLMNANKRRRQGPVETLTIPEMIPKGQFCIYVFNFSILNVVFSIIKCSHCKDFCRQIRSLISHHMNVSEICKTLLLFSNCECRIIRSNSLFLYYGVSYNWYLICSLIYYLDMVDPVTTFVIGPCVSPLIQRSCCFMIKFLWNWHFYDLQMLLLTGLYLHLCIK